MRIITVSAGNILIIILGDNIICHICLGILTEGGTILGTSRQNYVPGKDIVDDKGNSVIPSMLQTYNRLNLDCLVIMGNIGASSAIISRVSRVLSADDSVLRALLEAEKKSAD